MSEFLKKIQTPGEDFKRRCYTDLEESTSLVWRGWDLLLLWIGMETFWNVIFPGKKENHIFEQRGLYDMKKSQIQLPQELEAPLVWWRRNK